MGKTLLNSFILLLVGIQCMAKEDTPVAKQAKVVVAVLDTGIDPALMDSPFICKTGHKDFTGSGLVDNHGHGTHIAGLVEQYAKGVVLTKRTPAELDKAKADFCIIVIKYYDPKVTHNNFLMNTIKAIDWAINQNVDIINYSGGGAEPDAAERAVVLKALNKGIKFVAAAGNERNDIDKVKYYPAMYDSRIFIVGNLVDSKVATLVASSSNFGKSVNTWEIGSNVLSRMPGKSFGTMTGTSQACAVKSGKLVREMLNH